MANERVRGNDIGATGETVARNLARVRKAQQLSLAELSQRLSERGRPISTSGLSKIENGTRRVDVDDLLVLALALDTSPLGLLLPTDDSPSDVTTVAGAEGETASFWLWALAEMPLYGPDERSFRARSLPYWLSSHPDLTWYGTLQLSVGDGDGERTIRRRIEYAAKNLFELEQRHGVDDGEHPATS